LFATNDVAALGVPKTYWILTRYADFKKLLK
jgi:hypothetical protein